MSGNLFLRFAEQAQARGETPCLIMPEAGSSSAQRGSPTETGSSSAQRGSSTETGSSSAQRGSPTETGSSSAQRGSQAGTSSTVPYAALDERSARLAQVLVARGVRPGDRVAVQVGKSADNVMLYLATLRAGAVYLPLNTAYKEGELAYFFGDAEPRLIVCDPARADAIRALPATRGVAVETLDAAGGGSLIEAAVDAPASFETVPRDPDDLAAILYTSGTTGRSKGAMLTHGNLAANADALTSTWRITAADVLLHALPIYHTHGLFTALNTTLGAGAKILFLPRFDAAQVIRLLPQCNLMMGVPTFYVRLLDQPDFTAAVCRNLRLFIAGSAPLLPETFRAFQERTGHAILERYGMTETGMNTSNPYEGERRPGTVGRPLPGVEARITGEGGEVLPDGATGMIEVRGPNVFKGYWRLPEKTAEEFRADGFFITGDLGWIDPDGYIHIVGRAKDLIISGGYNVYPKEIELVIDALDGVRESAVFGVPHPDFGEAVAAAVVPEAEGRAPEEGAVIEAVKRQLANFKVPKRVMFTRELPRNAMGKVEKNRLREAHKGLFRS